MKIHIHKRFCTNNHEEIQTETTVRHNIRDSEVPTRKLRIAKHFHHNGGYKASVRKTVSSLPIHHKHMRKKSGKHCCSQQPLKKTKETPWNTPIRGRERPAKRTTQGRHWKWKDLMLTDWEN